MSDRSDKGSRDQQGTNQLARYSPRFTERREMQQTLAQSPDNAPEQRPPLRRRLTRALARRGAWGSDEQTRPRARRRCSARGFRPRIALGWRRSHGPIAVAARSEEHTSELQS